MIVTILALDSCTKKLYPEKCITKFTKLIILLLLNTIVLQGYSTDSYKTYQKQFNKQFEYILNQKVELVTYNIMDGYLYIYKGRVPIDNMLYKGKINEDKLFIDVHSINTDTLLLEFWNDKEYKQNYTISMKYISNQDNSIKTEVISIKSRQDNYKVWDFHRIISLEIK